MSPQLCPKVSIVSTTHNQAGYARQAFDSFLDQQTDFPVEIIVADDASTDATPAIIREYAERYPHVFRPIFRTENLGLNGNLTGALSAARGEYVALCEADDYWIDPLKLSKQVAFLDRHPKTTVCFHPVRVIWEDGHAKDSKFPGSGAGQLEPGCVDLDELHPDQLGRVPSPRALRRHSCRRHAPGLVSASGTRCMATSPCCPTPWPCIAATPKACGTTRWWTRQSSG